jgi:mannitol-1-phosphate/altronate dehydrogenase
LVTRLAEISKAARGVAADVDLFLLLDGVFPDALKQNPRFVKALTDAYANLWATAAHSA